jgi:hypothetical protein
VVSGFGIDLLLSPGDGMSIGTGAGIVGIYDGETVSGSGISLSSIKSSSFVG